MTGRRAKVVPAAGRLAAKAKAERSARRRRIARRAGLVAAGLAPLALLGWLLLSSPLLAVRTVAVSGTSRLTPAEVRAAAHVVIGTPLARVDDAAVVRRVEALRPVEAVQVSRGWPGTLRIRVVERRPMVGIVDGHRVTLLDADGVAFASVAALPPGVVRLQVTRPGPKDPATLAALHVLADLTGPMRGRVRIIRAASPSSVTLVLHDGRRVLWGGAGQTALKLEAAEVLLTMPGTVFDVSRPEVVTRR